MAAEDSRDPVSAEPPPGAVESGFSSTAAAHPARAPVQAPRAGAGGDHEVERLDPADQSAVQQQAERRAAQDGAESCPYNEIKRLQAALAEAEDRLRESRIELARLVRYAEAIRAGTDPDDIGKAILRVSTATSVQAVANLKAALEKQGEELAASVAALVAAESRLRQMEEELQALLAERRSTLRLLADKFGHFVRLAVNHGGWLTADEAADGAILSWLEETQLFDPDWYLATNPDLSRNRVKPGEHYLTFGIHEGRLPSRLFDGK